jgi:AraC-like DNA-binding protein
MSGAWVRSGVLVHSARLIRELGGDPAEVCRLSGVSEAVLEDPDMPVAAAGVVAFLAQAAATCDCPTFGLRLAGRQDLSGLGPLWLLMRSADNVGQLIADLARYFVIHTRGASIGTQPAADGSLFVTYHMARELPIDDRQLIELGLAMFCNEIRHHAEPGWEPASVQFCHRAPDDLALHRRFFGPALSFDQDRNAVRIQPEVLARPLAAADERSRRMLNAVLAGRQSRAPAAALSRIEGAIRAMMPFSACTVGEVASAIGTSPRTLQRQLTANGTTFQELRDRVRADLALKYLRQSTLRFGEISEILGFAEPSVFSRSFRRWHGCTPRDARRRIAAAGPGAPSGWTPLPMTIDRH